MRLAAIQYETTPGADHMARLIEATRQTLGEGADFVVLPERPVIALPEDAGLEWSAELDGLARSERATIVGCNLHEGKWPDGTECVRVHQADGATQLAVRTVRHVDAGRLDTARTALGGVAVLSGVDCYSATVLDKEVELPSVLVMQVSAASSLESEAIRELALARSEAQVSLVIVTALLGRVDSSELCGGTSIMLQGEVLAEAGDHAETLWADVDPADFVNLALLRHPVRIPELLRQKTEHI